jgi:4-hydroxy-tetrahydrodipicolinate reductase
MGGAPVRAVLVGFGRVNQATLRLAGTRPWLQVTEVAVRSPARHNVPAAAHVAGAPAALRLPTDLPGALARGRPQVALIATHSRLTEVREQLAACAAAGVDIVCTAEELAYVEPQDGGDAQAIHELARRHRVAILAAGVNPGFVLDLWPLVLSGVAWDVRRLSAARIVDVSVFGPTVRQSLGIGYAPADFQAGVESGQIAGHLGFRESLRLVCTAMGRPADGITIETEPIVARQRIDLADGVVEPGQTAGARQRAIAWRAGQPWIEVALTLHVQPSLEGLTPVDEVRLEGEHDACADRSRRGGDRKHCRPAGQQHPACVGSAARRLPGGQPAAGSAVPGPGAATAVEGAAR